MPTTTPTVTAFVAINPATLWYADTDSDGFGNPSSSQASCTQPASHVLDNTDCDDTSAATFPGAAANDSSTACMKDVDGDDYGDSTPPGGVTAGTDCDDDASAVNTDATEVCDGIDNDCDTDVDEGC